MEINPIVSCVKLGQSQTGVSPQVAHQTQERQPAAPAGGGGRQEVEACASSSGRVHRVKGGQCIL